MVLGASAFVEARALLQTLLQDPVPNVVCAAVRALGQVDPAALRQWGLPALDAGGLPDAVQAEVLMTLARHGDETAIERVMEAAVDATDTDLVAALLERLPGMPADVAVPVLQAVVAAPQGTAELRAQAFDALSDVEEPEAAALLLQYATQRSSVADRRQAAEALATIPEAGVPARQLAAAAREETDVRTRVALYDAMRNLAAPDPAVLAPVLQAEQEPLARIAALLSAGTLVGMGKADTELESWFETEGVRRLEESATAAAVPSEYRLRAVSGLRNAGTPAAQAALARLAQSDDPLVRGLAAQPLPRSR
jgi:HEAT repeat protein